MGFDQEAHFTVLADGFLPKQVLVRQMADLVLKAAIVVPSKHGANQDDGLKP